MERPLASVVILNHNGLSFLGPCLESLMASRSICFEVIVVDNASTDGSLALCDQFGDRVRVVKNRRNILSSRGLNRGIACSHAPFVVFLDTDTEVRQDWLKELIKPLLEDEGVAITGSKLLLSDGVRLQHAGGYSTGCGMAQHFGYGRKDDGSFDEPRDVEYVTGAAMAVRRSFLSEIGGGFDPLFPFYFEDFDLCAQALRLGYRVRYVPSSVAIHHESVGLTLGSRRYILFFHRGRLRHVFKNLPMTHLATRFPLEEYRWLKDNKWLRPVAPAIALSYASLLPALPTIAWRRVRRRLRERRGPGGPMNACIMASSIFLRANGDLSCSCDAGKETRLDRVLPRLLDEPSFDLVNRPALRGIRRSFAAGKVPDRGRCGRCALLQNPVVTTRSQTRRCLRILHLEPASVCPLKCPDCVQPRREPPRTMDPKLLESVLANLRRHGVYQVGTILFEGLGEPTVNRHLSSMIRKAKSRYPHAVTVLTTNGNATFAEAIGDAPLDSLRVSIDGVSDATYRRFRRGGDFDLATGFLRDAGLKRRETGRPKEIWWRYILYDGNDSDDEIRLAGRMAEDLGVRLAFDLSFAGDVTRRFSPDTLDRKLQELAPRAVSAARERIPTRV